MEVPPGRVERISDGGEEAIRAILAELRAMKFNGLLKTSVFRGDTPSQGVLVLPGWDGVLAEHRSKVDIAGPTAVPEILKDASSERAQLEVRTYDYGHSAISIDQLQRTYPEAAVKGLGSGRGSLESPDPRGRGTGRIPPGPRRPSRTGTTARGPRGGAVQTEMGAGTGVPTEWSTSEGTRIPPSGAAGREGGERHDHAAPRGTPDRRGCGDPVPAKSAHDGIGEGPRGAGNPTAEPDGEDREGGGPRTGFRGSAGVPRRSGDVDRGAGGIPRAGAPADERSVCEPPGGNGEDLRSTRSLRHPTRRCRTPGARVDPPRAGEWRGGRPTTTIRCRRFRPRENGRRPGKGHGVSVEGPGTPGGEDRGRSRGNGETRGSARRPRDDAGRSARRTRPGDRAYGEDREGTGHEGPQGGGGRTRGAAAARGSPTPRTRTRGPGKGIGTAEPPAL